MEIDPAQGMFTQHLPAAREHFRRVDPILAALADRLPPPAIVRAPDRLLSLVNAIVNQQLSGRAADTILRRLLALFPEGMTPDAILAAPVERLREAGLSRAKAASIQDLAARLVDASLDLAGLDLLDDEAVVSQLVAVKGIGRWTAEMFLIFSLGRPDVLPVTDLGFRSALRRHYQLDELPQRAQAEAIAASWRPYSSIATLYLWRSLDEHDSG